MNPSFRDRPPSLDQDGRRIPLFQAEVRGVWRTRRTWVQAILIVVFLILPWIQIGGEPAILLNVWRGEFALFGLRLWAHDAPLIFFLLAGAALTLALATALFGRAWCGWACPQTVFLDGVFRRIEFWIEGNHLQRRELARAPMSIQKLWKKAAKNAAFIVVTLILTHSFLAYWVGADKVREMTSHSPGENPGTFAFVMIVSILIYLNFAWFREQLCLIVCPYGRIQSVLMDNESVTVQYDSARGEPRKQAGPGNTARGACVNCLRCVRVCPTGIDIRNGVQLECIGCTACMDACDEIMDKVKQPRGLIRYMNSKARAPRWFRPRTLLYGGFLLALSAGLAIALTTRAGTEITLLRALDTPYFQHEEAGHSWIVNSYRLHVHNESGGPLTVSIRISQASETPSAKLQAPAELTLRPGEFRMIPFTVEVPADEWENAKRKTLEIQVQNQTFEVILAGPHS